MRFRPGARSVRLCLGIVVTFLSTAGCAPAPDRASHSVEDYREDAKLRREEFERCRADLGALKDSPDCINAQEAERSEGVGNLRDLPPLKLPENKK
jgi:hypothetical protein